MRESAGSAMPTENAVSSREVFAELYEQYMPGVYRYIIYRVGNSHLAEDLTSTVFEKALTGFRRYQADVASFYTWLMSIARHVVIDHYRTQSKRRNVPLEEADGSPSDTPSPEQAAVRSEELRRLRFCLSELSPKEHEIISLKFGAEMNNRRVAGLLSLSESNVGTILYRAVRKLRDCFRMWLNERGR